MKNKRSFGRRTLALVLAVGVAMPQQLLYAQTTVAGFTPGSFRVSETGAAMYEIPIKVPPGTAGMEPKLSLIYNSQAGNGLLGMGWSLSGLSIIARCPRTVAQDGARGTVNYDANDRFCLDGQRLVMVSAGSYGAVGAEYRTERDGFAKIVSNEGTAGNPLWFEVKTKSGLTLQFGNSSDSRIEAQGKTSIRTWALNRIHDIKGNYLTVNYIEDNPNGDFRPDQVRYGSDGGSYYAYVRFDYADRTDNPPIVYVGGSLIKTIKRLTNIKTFLVGSPDILVRDYRFAYVYGTATGRSRATTVTECDGSGNCLPAISLQSSDATGLWSGDTVWGTRTDSFNPNGGGFQLADVNGDGLLDLIYDGNSGMRVLLNTGMGFGADTLWGVRTQNYAAAGFRMADVNGDGKDDVVYDGDNGVRVLLSTGTAFSTDANWGARADNLNGNNPGGLRVVDVNGDGKADIVYEGWAGTRVMLSTGTGFPTDTIWGVRADSFNGNDASGLHVVDLNGDGLADVAYEGGSGFRVMLNTGSAFGTDTVWGVRSDSFNANGGGTKLADVNGDGLPDLIYDGNTGMRVLLNMGNGLAADALWGVRTQNYAAAGFRMADVNGDGRTDVVYDGADGVRVLLSTGTAFASDANWGARADNLNGNNAGGLRVADVNGDGKADVVYEGWNGSRVMPSAGAFPDLATFFANGIGATNTPTHKPLTDSSVYTMGSGAVWPVRDLRVPLYVVSTVAASNGIGGNTTQNYTYQGAKAHMEGRGFLGFTWMEGTQSETGIKVRTTFRQDWPYVGLPSQVKRTQSSGAVLTQVDNTYACKDFDADPDTCTVATGKRYFPYVSQADEVGYDLNGAFITKVRTTNQFDLYGNAASVVVTHLNSDGSATGYSKTTGNLFVNDTTNWILGRLTSSTVTSTTP